MGFERLSKLIAGELCALIGIEDLRRPISIKRLIKGFNTKQGIERVG